MDKKQEVKKSWMDLVQPPSGMGRQTLSNIKWEYKRARVAKPFRGSKVVFVVTETPLLISDDSVIIFEHGFCKLYSSEFELVKSLKCKLGDRMEYNGEFIFHQASPKIKWRRILWKVGLVKSNWKHPNTLNMKEIDDSAWVQEIRDNIVYELIIFRAKSGSLFWYCHTKVLSTDILEALAVKANSLVKKKNWVKEIHKEMLVNAADEA